MGKTRAKPIDAELVRSLFCYSDGSLVWRVDKGRAQAGSMAGMNSAGYKVIEFNGSKYLEHRLIWAWHHGQVPDFIDHKNGNSQDNRIENLRAATHSENTRNAKLRIDNKSGVKGVCWVSEKNLWKVQIWANGKQNYVGKFKDLADAKAAAESYRAKHHFGFANNGV